MAQITKLWIAEKMRELLGTADSFGSRLAAASGSSLKERNFGLLLRSYFLTYL